MAGRSALQRPDRQRSLTQMYASSGRHRRRSCRHPRPARRLNVGDRLQRLDPKVALEPEARPGNEVGKLPGVSGTTPT